MLPLSSRRHRLLCGALIATLGILLYGHTLNVPWYLDDWSAVLNDGHPLSLSDAWSRLLTPRGLTMLTFAGNIAVNGFARSGFHLVNITIHLAAAIVVLLLLGRAFPRERWLPLLGALLFVAHPLQTQAVTYTVQRMSSLAALLSLCSLYALVRGRELLGDGVPFIAGRHLAWYGSGLVCGALALLAKENAVVLPLLLVLFFRSFPPQPERSWPEDLRYLAPTLLAPLLCIALFLTPVLLGKDSFSTLGHPFQLSSLAGNDPWHYLVTEFSVIWIYLRLLVLPVGQALDYGYPVSRELITAPAAIALLGLLGLIALAWRLRRRQPAIACGIAWFLLALAPESSIIPLDPLYEHRLYLPLFGCVLVVIALFARIPQPRRQLVIAIVILLPLALLTWQRNRLWNDPIAFWEDNLRRHPQNERVCYNLSNHYRKGREAEIEALLRRALTINPAYGDALKKLADQYQEQGRASEAVALFETALRSAPRDVLVLNLYAETLNNLRDREGALRQLRIAERIDPRNPRTHDQIGRTLFRLGDPGGAERSLRQALALDPQLVIAHRDLAYLLRMQRRFGEAAAETALADRLEPARDVTALNPHATGLF